MCRCFSVVLANWPIRTKNAHKENDNNIIYECEMNFAFRCWQVVVVHGLSLKLLCMLGQVTMTQGTTRTRLHLLYYIVNKSQSMFMHILKILDKFCRDTLDTLEFGSQQMQALLKYSKSSQFSCPPLHSPRPIVIWFESRISETLVCSRHWIGETGDIIIALGI